MIAARKGPASQTLSQQNSFMLCTAKKGSGGITERVCFHTFRHTYTTLLTQNNEDVKVVQELLRHANSRQLQRLLQLRIFCFGLFVDGDVGIGVFPEREEILIRGVSFVA